MADFNTTLGATVTPDQSRASEGFKDNALGSLFTNVAESFQVGLKATDDFLKRRVNEDARNMVEPLQDAAIAELAGFGVPQETETRSIPQEGRRELDRLSLVRQGVRAGRLSDSYYRSQLDVVSKKLRRSYPGYEDEIDNAMQNLTGSIPANTLLADLQAEANSLASGESEASKSVQNAWMDGVKQGDINPDVNPLSSMSSLQDVARLIAPRRMEKATIDMNVARINAIGTGGEGAQKEASRGLQEDMYNTTTRFMSEALNPGSKNFQELKKKIDSLGDRNTWSPAETEQYNALMRSAEQSLRIDLNKLAAADIGGTSRGAIAGQESTNKFVEEQVVRLSSALGGIKDQQKGILNHNAAIIAARTDGETAEVLRYEDARAVKALKELGGDALLNQYYSQHPETLTSLGQVVHDAVTTGVATGQYRSLADATSKVGDTRLSDGEKKKLGAQIVGTLSKTLSDPKVPLELKVNTVLSMYGPNNEKFITRNLPMYIEMSRPENIKAVKELSDSSGRPELWNSTQNWILKTGVTLASRLAGDLQGGVVNRKFVTVTYDPKSNLFSVVPRDRVTEQSDINVAQRGAINLTERYILEPQLKGAVNTFNSVIQSMKAVVKADDPRMSEENMNAWVKSMTASLGVDPSVPKGVPGVSSFFSWLNETVGGAGKSLFNIAGDGTIRLLFSKNPDGTIGERAVPGTILGGSGTSDLKGGDAGDLLRSDVEDALAGNNASISSRDTLPSENIMDFLTGAGLNEEQARKISGAVGLFTDAEEVRNALASGDPGQMALAALTLVPGTGAALKAEGKLGKEALKVIKNEASTVAKVTPKQTATKVVLTPDDLARGETFSSMVEKGKSTVVSINEIKAAKIADDVLKDMDKETKSFLTRASSDLLERGRNVYDNIKDVEKSFARTRRLMQDVGNTGDVAKIDQLPALIEKHTRELARAGDWVSLLKKEPLNSNVKAGYLSSSQRLESLEEEIFQRVKILDDAKESFKLKEVK